MQAQTRTVKVAVVGSGLAGLTAAYRLSRTPRLQDVEFEVHLFEKTSSLGMDSHSVTLSAPGHDGRTEERRVDVPMRSFQGGYYPQLIALYKHLGVEFYQADFSYSFSELVGLHDVKARKITTTMIYNGASGREGVSMPSSLLLNTRKIALRWPTHFESAAVLMTQLHSYGAFLTSVVLLLFFYLRLVLLSLPIHVPEKICLPFKPYSMRLWLPFYTRPVDKRMTLLEWTELTTPRYVLARMLNLDSRWQEFVAGVLIPLFSAVCTADWDRVWNHPVEEFLDYVWLTFGTHHYVVRNGVRDVVARITQTLSPSNIHLASPIIGLVYHADESATHSTIDIHCTNNVVYSGFDHVILATQANHAASLLDTYLDTLPSQTPGDTETWEALARHYAFVAAQSDSLRKFDYCKTIVVNHTDSALLPSSQQDWRDLNLVMATPSAETEEEKADEYAPLFLPPTYAMATHVLNRAAGLYQTTNPIVPPAPESVLSVARLERAVVTIRSKDVLTGFWCERNDRPWKWGTAGNDGGALGPLQGAGCLLPETEAKTEGRGVKRLPGVWVCGSYAHCGIPLLEGCVVSGRNVVEQGVWASEGVDAGRVGRLW